VTTAPKRALDAGQEGVEFVDNDVDIDGLLVTGRGYQQNTQVLKEFLAMLRSAT
jgi:protease I